MRNSAHGLTTQGSQASDLAIHDVTNSGNSDGNKPIRNKRTEHSFTIERNKTKFSRGGPRPRGPPHSVEPPSDRWTRNFFLVKSFSVNLFSWLGRPWFGCSRVTQHELTDSIQLLVS